MPKLSLTPGHSSAVIAFVVSLGNWPGVFNVTGGVPASVLATPAYSVAYRR
ncbi:MAG: hypothetical protein HY676_06220 [Chloroflexi bacterium]|nr:hypothetical protein [Chloroflexota bacterium]